MIRITTTDGTCFIGASDNTEFTTTDWYLYLPYLATLNIHTLIIHSTKLATFDGIEHISGLKRVELRTAGLSVDMARIVTACNLKEMFTHLKTCPWLEIIIEAYRNGTCEHNDRMTSGLHDHVMNLYPNARFEDKPMHVWNE